MALQLTNVSVLCWKPNASRECDPVHIAASSFPNAQPVGSQPINMYQATDGRFSSLLFVIIPTYIFRFSTHLY